MDNGTEPARGKSLGKRVPGRKNRKCRDPAEMEMRLMY